MKLQHLFWLAIVFTLGSCMWGKPGKGSENINTDTLAYAYKTIKLRATDCGDKPDSGCTVAIVTYPEFKGNKILNDSVKNRLFNLFWEDTTPEADTDLQKYAQTFLNTYEQSIGDTAAKGRIFTLNTSAKIVRQDSSLTTLQISGYMFNGGAHGTTETVLYNWNTKANKIIKLDDLFTPGYLDQLTAIGDTIFRRNEKLADDAPLAPNYFFKNDEFALTDNFMITPTGIRFLYNENTIKPHAAGQTELLIPYKKIKSLLLPHTVVSQYIK